MHVNGTSLQRSSPTQAPGNDGDVERAVIGACLWGGASAVEEALDLHLRDVDFVLGRVLQH